MRAGSISPRAKRKVRAKMARALGPRQKDEGELGNLGMADEDAINDRRFQRNGVPMPSRGGTTPAQLQEHRRHIDAARNKKVWPAGAQISSSNPHTGNTRMLGGMAGSNGNPGNWYTGGNGRSRG